MKQKALCNGILSFMHITVFVSNSDQPFSFLLAKREYRIRNSVHCPQKCIFMGFAMLTEYPRLYRVEIGKTQIYEELLGTTV